MAKRGKAGGGGGKGRIQQALKVGEPKKSGPKVALSRGGKSGKKRGR